jgi:uncharacterized membrane protein
MEATERYMSNRKSRFLSKDLGPLRSFAHLKNLGFKELLGVALVLQVAAFVAILLNVQIVRQVVGFFYLSFLPGFLFLKIIKLEKVGTIEYLLFSGGLSVAFLMLLGLISSLVYPAADVLKPLSGFPIVATILVFTFILFVVSWMRTRKNASGLGSENLSEHVPKNLRSLKVVPLLVCIPILTIYGTELVLTSGNNIILLFLVIITSAIVFLTLSERIVPRVAYPLAILAITMFLLFHTTLISNYIIGYDVHLEFYLANLTLNKGAWDLTIPHEYNAMLSITVLPVIYSTFLSLDLNWTFKIIYPLIFSLVPLSLFSTYKRLTSSRIAFLAVFFFMSMDVFFFTMLGLDRQMIGELFFALLILLMVDDKIELPKKTLLFVIFSAGLVVSHYALTYVFLFCILAAFYISRFMKRSGIKHPRVLSGGLALGCVALALFWYVAIAPTPFDALAATFNHIRQGLLTSASAPGVSGLMPSSISVLHSASQYIFYGLQLSIVIGLFGALFLYKKMNFDELYLSLSILCFFIMVLCIVIPSFAAGLVVSRFYHIASFLLAPFVVLGVLTFVDKVLNIRRLFSVSKIRTVLNLKAYFSGIRAHAKFKGENSTDLKVRTAGLFLVCLLVVTLFLFQVGFFYEISGDRPSSLPLSWERLHNNPNRAMDIWVAQTPDQDVYGAKWLSVYRGNISRVYSDYPASTLVLTSYGLVQTVFFSAEKRFGTWDYLLYNGSLRPAVDSYVYFRTINVVYGEVESPYGQKLDTSSFSPFLSQCNRVYDNGGSELYKSPP